ncbi:MAG: glycerol-3-phosphate dehydrogenase [Lentisphaeria bacterium]|nr:glycerol-3-phosphate dehydrogenase [Lentisphaeria bacterium]
MAIITIIGAGMMGSGMSRPARENGHEVRLVGTPLDREIIREASVSGRHVPMKRNLPDGIKYYQIEDVKTALQGTDYIICGVSSFGVDWFADEILPILPNGIPVLSVTKGLMDDEQGNLLTFPEFLASRMPKERNITFSAIGGPCTSYELMDKHQTMVYFCGPDKAVLEQFKALLQTEYYHIETSTDIRGVEGCVAMKNAYAVAVSMAIGMAERLDGPDAYMYNPQAAMFGQSIREMTRIVRLLGGNSDLAGGIPGAGDLFVTIFGGRTRRLGYLLGYGKTYAEAKEELKGVTLESVVIITRMSRALRKMAEQGKVDLADFSLLLFLDSVINQGAAADIPWNTFR